MTNKEKLIAAAGGAVGYFVGHVVGATRMENLVKKSAKAKANRADTDLMRTIQTWLHNTDDPRELEDVVDEWFFNNRFKKMLNG